MSNIGGTKRANQDFSKKVGLVECKVVAINPSTEEYKEHFNIELSEDSKATEYLGTSKVGNNTTLRIDVWLEAIKNNERFKVTFFLEDKVRENKEDSPIRKKQYINAVGSCSWADDPNHLPTWFVARDYREAFVGEEDLYNFLRTWLGELDYRSAETTLQLEWKKLMKGNVKDLTDLIDGEWCSNVIALATVIVKPDKEDETKVKEFQGIYNKAFLPPYCLKNFRLVDYASPDVIASLRIKDKLKPYEKFVLSVTDPEYGCKDFFTLKDIKEYVPEENPVNSNAPISSETPEY